MPPSLVIPSGNGHNAERQRTTFEGVLRVLVGTTSTPPSWVVAGTSVGEASQPPRAMFDRLASVSAERFGQELRLAEPIDGRVAPRTVEWTDLGDNVWMVGPNTATELFFHDATAADAHWATKRLRPQAYRVLNEPSPLTSWPDVESRSIVPPAPPDRSSGGDSPARNATATQLDTETNCFRSVVARLRRAAKVRTVLPALCSKGPMLTRNHLSSKV